MTTDALIIKGDCLNVMAGLPDGSIDAIVTDPPYGLGFMGKNWDHSVPGEAFWREALRVAKPGCHILAAGGSRTYHRLAVAIEDAGWEIRDCVMWLYGSGFPKSLNVSTAINKLANPNAKPNAEELEFCEWLRANSTREHVCSTLGRRFWDCEVQTVNTATKERPILGRRALVPTAARWRLFKAGHGGEIPSRIEQLAKPEPSRAETPGEEWTPGKGNGSVGCGQWSGWGTALKPAFEPFILARKPLDGAVASNVLTHGTGGINVDGCRVRCSGESLRGGGVGTRSGGWDRPWMADAAAVAAHKAKCNANADRASTLGRWPANVIHDGSDEVVAGFEGTEKYNRPGKGPRFKQSAHTTSQHLSGLGTAKTVCFYDSGSAARFFYCPKASKADRDEGCEGLDAIHRANGNKWTDQDYRVANGERPPSAESGPRRNHHPTVKPVNLMRYLCRLVTPPGGLILDPFCGSGSTGVAAMREGFNFIGMELNHDYAEIARRRIDHERNKTPLFSDVI